SHFYLHASRFHLKMKIPNASHLLKNFIYWAMKYIIGLDIGTSSTKAVAVDLHGKIIAKNQMGYPILNPQPSYFEQDPEEIWKAVLQTIAFVTKSMQLNAPKYTLEGISFSSAMHSLIAVDKAGSPLTNCIIW